jgi:hypothetical protein
MSDDPAALSDAAKLCLSCGLCCDGTLSRDAPLVEPGDLAIATRQRLRVLPDAGVFELKCSRLDGARCEVFPDRPSICGSFECALLARHRTEGGPLEEKLEAIRRTKELLAMLREKGMDPTSGVRTISSDAADGFEIFGAINELMQRLHTDFVSAKPAPKPLVKKPD